MIVSESLMIFGAIVKILNQAFKKNNDTGMNSPSRLHAGVGCPPIAKELRSNFLLIS